MAESALFVPDYGSMDKEYFPVSLVLNYIMNGSDPLTKNRNDTTQVDTLNKWIWNVSGGSTTRRQYSKYGLSVDCGLNNVSGTHILLSDNAKYTPIRIPHDKSFMLSASFTGDTNFVAGERWTESAKIDLQEAGAGGYAIFSVLYFSPDSPTPGIKIDIEYEGLAGLVSEFYNLPSSHPAYKSCGLNSRKIDIAVLWSKELFDSSIDALYVFINGYYAWSLPYVSTIDMSLQFSNNLRYGASFIRYYNGGGSVRSGNLTISDFRVLPVLLYGDNSSAYPYELLFNHSSYSYPAIGSMAMSDSSDTTFDGATYRYGGEQLPIYIENRDRSGFMPITIIYPISANVSASDLSFEVIMENRKHNNQFDKKPPVLMFDPSFFIGQDYNESGAVYESAGKESVKVPINIPGDTMGLPANGGGPNRVPGIISMADEAAWGSMIQEEGYGKIERNGHWSVSGISNYRETSAGMRNERSYPGAVCEFSSLGNAVDGSGNGGWPVCCDRSPSSPIEFYVDTNNPLAANIVISTGMKNIRFIGLNTQGNDRYKALMVGVRETANISGAYPTQRLVADLAIARILTNDTVDGAFGLTGLRTVEPNAFDSYIMYDVPRSIGITAPVFYQYPDIEIVPIGDPKTTTKHRIYWIGRRAGVGAGLYDNEIYYFDIENNGATNTSSSRLAVNIDYSLTHYLGAYSTSVYNMPVHFSIVQPEEGKFIMVVTLGFHVAPNSDANYDQKLITVTLTSTDGINFSNPSPVLLGSLDPGKTVANEFTYNCIWPKLTCCMSGENYGELLLSVTKPRGSASASINRTYIMRSHIDIVGKTTRTNTGTEWSSFIDCNNIVFEKTNLAGTSNYSSHVFGACAFRDPVGKVHVAINKKPSGRNPNTSDTFGGVYYVVLDDRSFATKHGLQIGSTTGTFGDIGNKFDIVSMSRFTWDNKMVDDNTLPEYDSYVCNLRPSFSPLYNDCFFTFNCVNASPNAQTTKARDPVYRLFQPTDLGELYPPMAAWNYSMHVPSEYTAAADQQLIWRMSAGGAVPTVDSNGVLFNSAVRVDKQFSFNIHTSLLSYLQRIPKQAVAVKVRARYTGTHAGLPIVPGSGVFCIEFTDIVWANVFGSGSNVSYLPKLYVAINSDSIAFGSTIAGATWTATGIDFSRFRDIYIVGEYDATGNGSKWNIYLERVYNSLSASGRRSRWMQKSYVLLNETPIPGPVNSSGMMPATETIAFGGDSSAGAGAWPAANTATCKFFQVYYPLYKDKNNIILGDHTGLTAIDGRSFNNIEVSGACPSLARRTKRFSTPQACCSGFQIGYKSSFSDVSSSGKRVNKSMTLNGGKYQLGNQSISNRFNQMSGWSIGNNTVMSVPNPENIEFDTSRYVFRYVPMLGVDNINDYNPRTTWVCSDITAPVRVCFDSNRFPNKLGFLSVNSIWFLNSNLINARLKASSNGTSWVAPFLTYNKKITFQIDSGAVTSAPVGTPGSDNVLYITDSTKNWTPNQFVDEDYSYYITHPSIPWYGGKIVRNTNNRIYYKLSTDISGALFNNFVLGSQYSIIAPHKVTKLDTTINNQRYWAIELMPNEMGDTQAYADGAAKIGEIGIGVCLELSEYGDVGFTETYKNSSTTIDMRDGRGSIDSGSGRIYREFDISFTNIDKFNANKIIDTFNYCKTKNIPVWFAPTLHNPSDIMLCDFADSQLVVQHIEDYQDGNLDYEDRTIAFSLTMKLRQRI